MTDSPRPTSPTDVVVRQVATIRKRKGWSAARLAAQCARVGAPQITESIIANLESGRRQHGVTVEELVAFARALDVPTVHLWPTTANDPGGGEEVELTVRFATGAELFEFLRAAELLGAKLATEFPITATKEE